MTDCSRKSSFVAFDTLPLGIPEQYPTLKLKSKLVQHINAIVDDERNWGEVLYDNTSQLTWDVHEAIWKFYHADPQVSDFTFFTCSIN